MPPHRTCQVICPVHDMLILNSLDQRVCCQHPGWFPSVGHCPVEKSVHFYQQKNTNWFCFRVWQFLKQAFHDAIGIVSPMSDHWCCQVLFDSGDDDHTIAQGQPHPLDFGCARFRSASRSLFALYYPSPRRGRGQHV